jgi:hypothetical protein
MSEHIHRVMRRVWRVIALALTPHRREYVGSVWGAGGHWRVACDVPDSCHRDCPWMRRWQKYVAEDTARAMPAARVVTH